jgi:cystathionine gamma-synthase
MTWRFETRAIHAGQEPDARTGAVVVPIYATSTYAQDGVGQHRGYEYSRTGNPTRAALETAVASLEGARFGYAFASGMAAEDAVLRSLRVGDHVVLGDDAYGGTFRLIDKVLTRGGVEWSAADLTDPAAVGRAMTDRTRIVWVETPTNPLLNVVDLAAVAAVTHEAGARLVVDNTFATPYLQRPLEHGADLVVHSSTKYLGGHSDVVGGFVATDDEELGADVAFVQNAAGGVPSPFDCFLVLRGLKTLAVRMDRHEQSARRVVEMLSAHPAVASVRWPGLASHPGHEVAARQMAGFGGMASFRLAGGRAVAEKVASSTRLWTLAESLGAVESLIEHPGVMTHASVAGSPLEVPDDLLRLSVGLEAVDDLVEDLEAALDGA